MVRNSYPTLSPSKISDGTLDDLERLLNRGAKAPKLVSADGEETVLPQPLFELLQWAVSTLVDGEKVSLIPSDMLLSTSKAAKILNVSRPYLIKLLDNGDIPSAPSVGSHRRVKAQDLLNYRDDRDRKRRSSVRKLSSFLQNEGFYGEDE